LDEQPVEEWETDDDDDDDDDNVAARFKARTVVRRIPRNDQKIHF